MDFDSRRFEPVDLGAIDIGLTRAEVRDGAFAASDATEAPLAAWNAFVSGGGETAEGMPVVPEVPFRAGLFGVVMDAADTLPPVTRDFHS